MAVTVTAVRLGNHSAEFDVEATANGDVAAVLPHGLRAIPLHVTLVPLLPNFYVSTWTVGVVDAVNVNLVKANVAGSGVAGNQIRVLILRPHSHAL